MKKFLVATGVTAVSATEFGFADLAARLGVSEILAGVRQRLGHAPSSLQITQVAQPSRCEPLLDNKSSHLAKLRQLFDSDSVSFDLV